MTGSMRNEVAWGFLYIGPKSIGWLNRQDQIVNPINQRVPVNEAAAGESGQLAGNDDSTIRSVFPSPAIDVKRRYLQHCLATTQPERCAIVLDKGSEIITMRAAQQTAATEPFYLSARASQRAVSLSRGNASEGEGRPIVGCAAEGSSRGDQNSSELSVISRLQRKADRYGQWPGQRNRAPVTSRQTLYTDQQQTLEWHALLVELTGGAVEIYAYPLVAEYLLQPLVRELPAVMVVAVQPDASIRHLFFRNGWLHFARQLPALPDHTEKSLQSSEAYVRQHLNYVESYPVFDCVSKSRAPIETVNQALHRALSQQQREFFFAVRRQAVDNLKRWRLESPGMKLQRRKITQARRVQTGKVAATVLTLVSGLSLVPSIAAMWQLRQQHTQSLHSTHSMHSLAGRDDATHERRIPQSGSTSMQQTLVHELPAALLKSLVDLPAVLYRQSYAEPAAVLLHLQNALDNYPQLLIDKVGWQWLQSEPRPVQSMASQLSVVSTYRRGEQSNPVVDLSASNTLQVSVEGHVAVTQFSGHTMNSVGRDLAVYESFLAHLKNTFGLQSLQQVKYPFGASPGSRLQDRAPASEPAFATRTVKDAKAFRRYSFEFSLDGVKVAGLLHRLNDSQQGAFEEGVSDPS